MISEVEFRKRVADVIAIVGRDKISRAAIGQAIRDAQPRDRPTGWPPHPLNKTEKQTARRVASALDALRGKFEFFKEPKRRAGRYVPEQPSASEQRSLIYRAAGNEFMEWLAQLDHWHAAFAAFAGDVIEGPSLLGEGGNKAWPLGHAKKSTDTIVLKQLAAKAAARLLSKRGIRLTVTRRTEGREGSTFCRVVAALYGNKRADLSYQCRVYKKAQKRGAK